MSFVLADRTVPSPSSNAGSLDLDDDEPADPGSQAWLDYCAQAIIAAHADGGRVLVLPTSFATLAALVERTEKDRKSGGSGKSVSVSVDLGGGRYIKKKKIKKS